MRRPSLGKLLLLAGSAGCATATLEQPEDVREGISLTVTSPQVEVARGQVELVVANVTRSGGYAGDIVMVVDSAPVGLRAEVSAYETANGLTSAYVAVFVDPTVEMGTYHLALRALAFGLPDVSTSFSVVVEPTGTPAYTLESRPIAVVRGSNATVSTYIDRGANTRDIPVSVSAQSFPIGVTVSLYPVTTAKAISNMTIAVGAGVAPGRYDISIRGTAPALTDRFAVIPLIVLPN